MAYALKHMIRLSRNDQKQPLLGPHVFLAPMVQNDGVRKLQEMLEYIQQLEDSCLHKWRVQRRVAELLRALLEQEHENPLHRCLQQHIRDAVVDESFSKVLCRLPPADCIQT